jgi:hypothetical protein
MQQMFAIEFRWLLKIPLLFMHVRGRQTGVHELKVILSNQKISSAHIPLYF